MRRVQDALKVRPGEGRMAALLVGLMLSTSAGGSIGGNGIDALFFARFGVQFLPYMYVALGAITLATSLGITALLGRVARERLYVFLPAALAAVLVVERVLVALGLHWFYPVLWLGMNVMGALQGLLTWGLAGAACDTRQAKRLFPLFGAGGILGAVVGGLATSPLAGLLGAENLLLVWAAALLAAFALGRPLLRTAPPLRAGKGRRGLLREMQQGYHAVRRSPLLGWMAAAVALFAVLTFSLAFPFSKQATAEFPSETALASFLGRFQGLSTGAAFLASLFFANRFFARFGLMAAVLVAPLVFLVGFGVLAVSASFPALVVFRFAQTLWYFGVAGTAYHALYNVIPSERRDQARAFIEGVPGQAGTALAGVILVIGEQALQARQLYLVGLAVAAIATFAVWRARSAYGGALLAALRAGQPQVFFAEEEPFGGFVQDAAAVSAAVAGLSSAQAATRRVSAEILGHLSAPQARRALLAALDDQDAGVRAAALQALARGLAREASPAVAARLADADPEVRLRAVEALNQLVDSPEALAPVRPLLDDPEPAVRVRAAVALLCRGPDPRAREALLSLASSDDAEARALALAGLADWGDPLGFDLAAAGLRHHAPVVRRAAAESLARLDAARALEPLLRTLGDDDRSVREAVALALAHLGPPALEPTLAALADPSAEEGALLALERLPGAQAAQALRLYAQEKVSAAVRYHDLAGRVNPDGDERLGLLADSAGAVARRQATLALRAVGLLGARASIALALDGLASRDPAQRANALETLESLGERRLVRPLVRLWEPVEAAAAAADSALLPLLGDADAWLRACAALAARGSDDPQVGAALARLAESDPDPLVRDAASRTAVGRPPTAAGGSTTAHRGPTVENARPRTDDQGPSVAAGPRSAVGGRRSSPGGATVETLPTLSLMERVLFLKRVPLFAGLAPADIKHVAAAAIERLYPDGEALAHQDEPGDELFIIVSGEVRVLVARDGSQAEIARRRSGEYVGEMAILSQEPRMASLVAGGEVRALCLDRQRFEGILRERPETSLAVMRVLCERLRESGR